MERFVLWHRLLPTPRDEADDVAALAGWTKSVVDRMLQAGGEVTAAVGSAVAADFDPADAERAMELALHLLAEAGSASKPTSGIKIAIGAGFGTIDQVDMGVDEPTVAFGGAYDRAQLLANRARAGELVLDAAAREHVAHIYLFGRTLNAAGGTIKGVAVDRVRPRREACRGAIRHLAATAVPPSAAETLAQLQAIAERDGIDRVVLRAPIGWGAAEWVGIIERAVQPPLVVRVGATPGGLEPLGSLRLALLRLWRTPAGVTEAARQIGCGDPASLTALEGIAGGRAVEKSAVVSALVDLLDSVGGKSRRAWIVLDPLVSVDPATVEVVAEATGDGGPPLLLISRLPPDTRAPSALAGASRLEEIAIPRLRTRDARALAEALLGPKTMPEVARRVATLGAESALGVVEAARTLIASGDLVWDGRRFTWRVGPRGGVQPIPVESLLRERLASLSGAPMRLLEAICVVPVGASDVLLQAVAELDGIRDDEREAAIELLRAEALVAPAPPLRPTSTLLRQVVTHHLPPARSGELHRWVGQAMGKQPDADQAAFRRATRGFYLGEGGLDEEGARDFLAAAAAAVASGFSRSAVRLCAAAVQLDPSQATRKVVAELTRGMGARLPAHASRAERVSKDTQPDGQPAQQHLELDEGSGARTLPRVTEPQMPAVSREEIAAALRGPSSAPPSPLGAADSTAPDGSTAIAARADTADQAGSSPAGGVSPEVDEAELHEQIVARAVEAIRARDFDEVERCAEMSIATGAPRAAAERIRAMAQLARGDAGAAMRILARSRRATTEGDPRAEARASLALALALLGTGDAGQAVRAALGALATARSMRDPRGEAAAMHTLAACYRALGRETDAAAIDEASPG